MHNILIVPLNIIHNHVRSNKEYSLSSPCNITVCRSHTASHLHSLILWNTGDLKKSTKLTLNSYTYAVTCLNLLCHQWLSGGHKYDFSLRKPPKIIEHGHCSNE